MLHRVRFYRDEFLGCGHVAHRLARSRVLHQKQMRTPPQRRSSVPSADVPSAPGSFVRTDAGPELVTIFGEI